MRDDNRTDQEVLRVYCESMDKTAFDEIYQRYSKMVYSACHGYLNVSADAEDASLACFVVFADKASSLRGKNVAGWLYRCAVNISRNLLRVKHNRAMVEQEAFSMEVIETSSTSRFLDILPYVETELAELPADQNEVLVLQFYRGLTHDEIARETGTTRGTVAGRVHRGMETLRKRLTRKGHEIDAEVMASGLTSMALILPVPYSLTLKLADIAKGEAVGGAVAELVRATLRSMFWAQVKTAGLIGGGIAAAVIAAVAVLGPLHTADVAAQMQVRECSGEVVIERAGKAAKACPGAPVAEGDRIATASNSYCRLECADKTMLAMNEQSRLKVTRVVGRALSELTLEGGDVYVDAPKRETPMAIVSGGARCEVTGSKFMVGSRGAESLCVVEGQVKYSVGGSVGYIDAGKMAVAVDRAAGDSTPIISVAGAIGQKGEDFGWLNNIGLDGRHIAQSFAADGLMTDGTSMDFNNYRIVGGTWNVARNGNDHIVRQENPAQDLTSGVIFGKPQWKTGVITLKFRVLESAGDLPRVGVLLCYGLDQMGGDGLIIPRDALPDLRKRARNNGEEGWIAMRVRFEIDGADRMRAVLKTWPEREPFESVEIRFDKNPQNSDVKKRGICAAGLVTQNCSVELKDLKVESARVNESAAGDRLKE